MSHGQRWPKDGLRARKNYLRTSSKTVKVEIPFQRLLNVIDQLTTDEKLVLKKRLEKEKVTTWQERFGKALQYLGKKNKGFYEKEVEEDVKRAIAEVRSSPEN